MLLRILSFSFILLTSYFCSSYIRFFHFCHYHTSFIYRYFLLFFSRVLFLLKLFVYFSFIPQFNSLLYFSFRFLFFFRFVSFFFVSLPFLFFSTVHSITSFNISFLSHRNQFVFTFLFDYSSPLFSLLSLTARL